MDNPAELPPVQPADGNAKEYTAAPPLSAAAPASTAAVDVNAPVTSPDGKKIAEDWQKVPVPEEPVKLKRSSWLAKIFGVGKK